MGVMGVGGKFHPHSQARGGGRGEGGGGRYERNDSCAWSPATAIRVVLEINSRN